MSVDALRKKLGRRKLKAPDLSPRQADALGFMLYCLLSGYLPSYREICEEMGISSPNGVVTHLNALQKKGYLEIHHGQGYQLSDKAMDLAI